MGRLFSPLFICHFFLISCKLFLLYVLYMGSMFIYISLYILWKPAIKTIIIIIIINKVRYYCPSIRVPAFHGKFKAK